VIEDIRRLMLEATEKETNNRETMIRRDSEVIGQQQQQGRRQYGQLQSEVWDPGGSQPQQ
jgi:hypothetical protein